MAMYLRFAERLIRDGKAEIVVKCDDAKCELGKFLKSLSSHVSHIDRSITDDMIQTKVTVSLTGTAFKVSATLKRPKRSKQLK